MQIYRKNLLIALALCVGAFALDQGSKLLVFETMSLAERRFIEVNPFLNFVAARNYGVNFGLFSDQSRTQQIGLAVFAGVVSLGALAWSATSPPRWLAIGAGLLSGGAIGNAYDRVTAGAVLDFINMHCCGIDNPYAFNIADVAIFLGALIIIVATWRSPSRDAQGS